MFILRKKKQRILLLIVFLVVLLFLPGLDSRMIVQRYEISSSKLTGSLRIALITDFHSCDYGEDGEEILSALEQEAPDFVLLGGDIGDDMIPNDNALALVRALSAVYPCYYVSGNHEFRSGTVDEFKDALRQCGVTVLEGDCVIQSVHGQEIAVCGVDDPDVGRVIWNGQLEQVCSFEKEGRFTLLLSHRPERIEQYLPGQFDLILSGHAHGGQWRIPGILNGLIAPQQGLFPKYAGGRYDFEGTTFLVSRGLARESTNIPRLYNRPELVIIDVQPAP